jgi:transcriptional antiterminator NusG
MADERFRGDEREYRSQGERVAASDADEKEHELEQDLARDERDVLEEDEGVTEEEIHPEAEVFEEGEAHPAEPDTVDTEAGNAGDDGVPDDGVHGLVHEAESGVEPLPVSAPEPHEDPSTSKHWYIIHAYSGFENKVAESLRTRAQAFGFADRLGQVLIPTEEVVELRNGKKVTSKRLLYPGYVLVEMEMDDELWHAVKSTPRVTGFVGGGTKPVPLTADEVNAVLYRQASSAERPRPKMTFEKNETVKIIDGPFTNFSGKVDEVNTERNTLRVMVTIFGRSTPVELDFLQVEKI